MQTKNAESTRETLAAVKDQLSDYVIPRLLQMEAPLLTVVGGSTGAGKSTLVNSLVGDVVTESGVLRPTTRSPVLVHHPDDAQWFQPNNILPDLPRTDKPSNDVYAVRLAPSWGVPRGLAILDAPDVDSIDADNRALATQLLAAADLWLFVTSAARYADQVPWDYLRKAAERSTSVAVLLDRTSAADIVEVRGHLARMMTARGLSDSPLFTIPESSVDDRGLLPRKAVEPVAHWLHELAADVERRTDVVFRTLDGAVRHNVMRTHDIADEMAVQGTVAQELRDEAFNISGEATHRVRSSITDSSMLRGEVLTAWQEFVGTGELARSIEAKPSRLRDLLLQGVGSRRTHETDVIEAIDVAMHALVFEAVAASGEAIARAWDASEAGHPLMLKHRGIEQPETDLTLRVERLVQSWQQRVTERVRRVGADTKVDPALLNGAAGAMSVAAQVMMLGRYTAEDARETKAARRVLTAIFGAAGMERLVATIFDDLIAEIEELFDRDLSRFLALVPSAEAVMDKQRAVREAARQAEYARHVDFLNGDLNR